MNEAAINAALLQVERSFHASIQKAHLDRAEGLLQIIAKGFKTPIPEPAEAPNA